MQKWKPFLKFPAHNSHGGRLQLMAGTGAGVLRAGHLRDFVLYDFEMANTLRQLIYIKQNVLIKKIQRYSKYVH